jgi:hypothetical protein
LPVSPKLVFDQMGGASPGNYGYHIIGYIIPLVPLCDVEYLEEIL